LSSQYSIIVLTYNEEIHLPRLLQSIYELNAPVYVLDSGSSDATVEIAKKSGAVVLHNAFENHPKQWDYALKNFNIQTPWVICLDADQIVTPELKEHLGNFRDKDHQDINGIYFNRKNYFKGGWIKHGGYYPFYLLKMIRFGSGHSDLNENMDHRLIVSGKTIIWKDGYIIEENLKENKISFWIDKHNRYSDLVASEEVERMRQIRSQTIIPRFGGSPDERTAWLKQLWWKLPRYVRPMLYFIYRIFFQLGFLDGRNGIIFHFLQGFWFRLVVDIKIDEILQNEEKEHPKTSFEKNELFRFAISFILLFPAFYYFNILFFSLTSPTGNHYSEFLASHCNYIRGLRDVLLAASSHIINWLGYTAITNEYDLLVAGHGTIQLIYSCLGLGVVSFFSAFVLSYPKRWKQKIIFLVLGISGIEFLNTMRFVFLAVFWDKRNTGIINHHTVFNIFIYLAVAISLYFWVKDENKPDKADATN